MANVSNPSGFRPVYNKDGTAPRLNQFGNWSIGASYSTALYSGDLVSINSTTRTNLELGTGSGANFVGVFMGCSYKDADGSYQYKKYWDGAGTGRTEIHAYVYDSPNTVFLVECDTSATPADTNLGKTADITASTTGSTLTGRSNMTLKTDSIGTDLNLMILDRWRAPDNETGAYAKYLVYINEHKYKS